MARRKILFVIVEGPSDEEALGLLFNRIYDRNTVYIHITHGDVTTEFNDAPNENIFTMIGDMIREYANSNHFKKSDFKEIIHIVDMDGAFIPDDYIIEDTTVTKTQYSITQINAYDKQKIENRNRMKRDNINKLCVRNRIWDVPYSVFYMSCNLDHVLYNKLNISDEEKEKEAFNFAKSYKDKIPEFISFMSDSEFSVISGYKESWDFIKQGLHSLERHSNLGLCFKENSHNDKT